MTTRQRLEGFKAVIETVDSMEAAGMRLSHADRDIVRQSIDIELELLELEMMSCK